MSDLIPWVGVLARIVLAVVFIAAAVGKLRNLEGFRNILGAYSWLPGGLRGPLAVTLPAFEFGLGVVLLSGAYVTEAVALAVALLLIFAAAFALTFGRAGVVDCGCFGHASKSNTGVVLTRNTSLALLGGAAMLSQWLDEAATLSWVVVLAAVLSSGALLLVSLLWWSRSSAEASPTSTNRRRFLKLAGGAVTGLAVTALIGVLRQPRSAEAACHGCGTCGTDYIFSHCVGPCCAAYLIKRYNHCDTYCLPCSTSGAIYCNVPVCC